MSVHFHAKHTSRPTNTTSQLIIQILLFKHTKLIRYSIVMHFCKVCNKGFSCGGALGGHMRAHGTEDINTRAQEENKHKYFLRTTTNRYVSRRAREEEYLANCLVMLSNGKVDDDAPASINQNSLNISCYENESSKEAAKGLFQCKACKKVFNSHQALGGHRASHKKVKGCFAADYEPMINDDNEDNNMVEENEEKEFETFPMIDHNHAFEQEGGHRISSLKRKAKMHECSMCDRVFSSGQALGGHKRCHWLGSTIPGNDPMPKFCGFEYYHHEQLFKKPMSETSESLDVNPPITLFDDNHLSKFEEKTRNYLPPKRNNELGKSHLTGFTDQNKAKVAKLSEMRFDGECSSWLQVGIESKIDGGKEDAS